MSRPSDKDIERALMGVLLADVPNTLPVAMAGGVRESWFEHDPWPVVWRAMERIWRDGKAGTADAASVLVLAQKLNADPKNKEVMSKLDAGTLSAAMDRADIGAYAESHIADLRALHTERRIKAAMAEVPKKLFFSDPAMVGAELRNDLDSILADSVSSKKISARALCDGILAEADTAYQRRIVEKNLAWTPGYRMPWEPLTRLLNGLRPGLHVIAARPSVGKTAFAVNLIRFWCEECKANVLLNSLDMPRAEMMRRFVCEKSRVSISKSLFSPTKEDRDLMRKASDAVCAWPLSITEIRDVDDFRTFCMVEKSAGRLGIVVCDYLGLFHARALGREDAVEYARVSYVSDTLKRLANELEVPVVALCQLNRESTKADQQGREPGLADLRGSGSIEQDAFTVTLLHRDQLVADKWKEPSTAPRQFFPGAMESNAPVYNGGDIDAVWWILCKSQNGGTGKYPFVSRKKYFCWMLGDGTARPLLAETGSGATKRTVADNTPLFSRAHADWRHDEFEEVLRRNGALIDDAPQPAASTYQPTFADSSAEDGENVGDGYDTETGEEG